MCIIILIEQMSKPYPSFFEKGCCEFFGLRYEKDNYTIDPYWNVSRQMIYDAMMSAFNRDWMLYIPNLKIPEKQTFIEYASLVSIRTPRLDYRHAVCISPVESPVKENLSFPNIGLAGEMGHGKSTVATYLCSQYQYTEYSFARPLKEGVKRLFSLTDTQVYGDEKNKMDERWGVSPRYLLQQVGTELLRNNLTKYLPQINPVPNLWIRNFQRWVQIHSKRVVVSDCRFTDECEALHNLGMKVYRVSRSGVSSQTSSNVHVSESLQKHLPVDDTIQNNGTLEELYLSVDRLMKTYE